MASKKDSARTHSRAQGRGRPAAEGDAIGREALLEAAERVLRRMRPSQVTRLAIAEEAGVDPNLIRYYFGTVPQLISEVVLRSHRMIFDALDNRADILQPLDWFRLRIAEWLQLFIDNPYHHQLLMQVMYADLGSEEHLTWTKSLDRSVGYTRAGLERGAEAGALRKVDPRFLQIAMLGMAEFFANNESIIKDLFGEDASPKKLSKDYEDFVFDLVTNGLRPR